MIMYTHNIFDITTNTTNTTNTELNIRVVLTQLIT